MFCLDSTKSCREESVRKHVSSSADDEASTDNEVLIMDDAWFKDFMKDVARGDSARFLK